MLMNHIAIKRLFMDLTGKNDDALNENCVFKDGGIYLSGIGLPGPG